MTVASSERPIAAPEHTRSPRLIGIGVRDADHDRAAIDWAVAEADLGDSIHVVHAYLPAHLDGRAWLPVSDVQDRRRLAAGRIVGQGVRRAIAGHPVLRVDGSVIGGLPDDVLIELSGVLDLVVVGEDTDHDARVAARVQAHGHCPVVAVPATYHATSDSRPVTVVGDDLGMSSRAVDFAAEVAQRRGVTLQVARVWSASQDGDLAPECLAGRQEEMDAALADLQDRYPHLPIAARIELVPGWIALARAHSSLVVAGPRVGGAVRARVGLCDPCPVAVVPDAG